VGVERAPILTEIKNAAGYFESGYGAIVSLQ